MSSDHTSSQSDAAAGFDVEVDADGALVNGILTLPSHANGLVLFVHGSGSSRFSPRNRRVAALLQTAGLATLLFDLLTEHEERIDERTRRLRFDIGLLSRRTIGAIDWLSRQPRLRELPLGLFGASTGAAAALNAAAARPRQVAAVVSRGGRPDLAMESLPRVTSPTLLLVGGKDPVVIDLNQQAAERLAGPHMLHIVAGAGHLFEQPGTLDAMAGQAREWFLRYLSGANVPG